MSLGFSLPPPGRLLTDLRSQVNDNVSALLRSNAPRGIGGVLFNIAQTESISDTQSITSHVMEDGSHMEDHVVENPLTMTLTGMVGENAFAPSPVDQFFNLINPLLPLPSFLGDIPTGLRNEINNAQAQINNVLNIGTRAAEEVLNVVDGINSIVSDVETNQAVIFKRFQSLKKTLLSVVTPWGVFDNMVITAISANQEADTMYQSTFSVTLQQARFASIGVALVSANELNRQAIDDALEEAHGEQAGCQAGNPFGGSDTSFLGATVVPELEAGGNFVEVIQGSVNTAVNAFTGRC